MHGVLFSSILWAYANDTTPIRCGWRGDNSKYLAVGLVSRYVSLSVGLEVHNRESTSKLQRMTHCEKTTWRAAHFQCFFDLRLLATIMSCGVGVLKKKYELEPQLSNAEWRARDIYLDGFFSTETKRTKT